MVATEFTNKSFKVNISTFSTVETYAVALEKMLDLKNNIIGKLNKYHVNQQVDGVECQCKICLDVAEY